MRSTSAGCVFSFLVIFPPLGNHWTKSDALWLAEVERSRCTMPQFTGRVLKEQYVSTYSEPYGRLVGWSLPKRSRLGCFIFCFLNVDDDFSVSGCRKRRETDAQCHSSPAVFQRSNVSRPALSALLVGGSPNDRGWDVSFS